MSPKHTVGRGMLSSPRVRQRLASPSPRADRAE